MAKISKLEFDKFCKEESNKETTSQVPLPKSSFDYKKFFIENKNSILLGLIASEGLANFAQNRSPFTLITSAFRFINETYADAWNPHAYFNKNNGWYQLNDIGSYFPDTLFIKTLKSFSEKTMSFKDNSSDCKIYTTPIAEIAVSDPKDQPIFYYREQGIPKEEIIKFLAKEKEKDFTSNLVNYHLEDTGSVSADKAGINFKSHFLIPQTFLNIDSDKSIIYVNYLKNAMDSNINRSILFYGPPGTGKSTLAQTILDKLKLKTLKFSFNHFDQMFLSFILTYFKFDAVLIDDFDHTKCDDIILLFLENLRKKVKVIFATANSLDEFHPAVIRPGRFDQIIKIDEIEYHSIQNILGPLSNHFADRVKKWPVAYINELVIRSKLYPIENIEIHFEELNIRVLKQIKTLEKSNGGG